jgi:integrase
MVLLMPTRLPLGTYGSITFDQRPDGKVRARASFREWDGVVRQVSAIATSRAAADRKLKAKLQARMKQSGVESTGRVCDLLDHWLTTDCAELAGQTQRVYQLAVERHLRPAFGQLRVAELRVPVIERALRAIHKRHPGAAKTARTVLSQVLQLAVRHGALPSNPVRDVGGMKRRTVRKPPTALTVAETEQLIDALRSSRTAVDRDLPDLAEWMLGTGMRIGEACAIRTHVLDLNAGTVEVNATVVRTKGQGLHIQERPKTAAGWRVLALPPHLVAMVERRQLELRMQRAPVVFCAPLGGLRDPSNTQADFRDAFREAGMPDITTHTFRKTVATRLDEAGLSPREIADQLGHSKPSMTLDSYMGRRVVSARAAEVLSA